MYFEWKNRQLDREERAAEAGLMTVRAIILIAIALALAAFVLAGCSPRIDRSDASTNVATPTPAREPNVEFNFNTKPKWRKAKTSAPATK